MASTIVQVVVDPVRPGEGAPDVIVDVAHLPTDSYSRSVRRAAYRALRGAPGAFGAYHETWDKNRPDQGGKSVTRITFTPTEN